MKSFKDNAGRTWVLSIHVAAVKKVRALAGVDLYSLVDDRFQGLAKLLNDPVSLVDVIYVLCRDEAEKLGVSDEDFGCAMAGDAIEHAARAFVEELVDFFPDPRVRAGLRKVIDAATAVKDRLMEHLEASVARIDPDFEANRLIASSTSSPAPSASTPGP
jgi:hypothetical protein